MILNVSITDIVAAAKPKLVKIVATIIIVRFLNEYHGY